VEESEIKATVASTAKLSEKSKAGSNLKKDAESKINKDLFYKGTSPDDDESDSD
jgi:hypothetical protein